MKINLSLRKKRWIWLAALTLTLGVTTATATPLALKQATTQSVNPNLTKAIDRIKNPAELQSTTTIPGLNRIQDSFRVPQIITPVGPIVYNVNTFSLLDWFGNQVWTVNIEDTLSAANYLDKDSRNMANTAFGQKYVWSNAIYAQNANAALNNRLYILTLATRRGTSGAAAATRPNNLNENSQFQYLVWINVATGELEFNSDPRKQTWLDIRGATRGGGGINAQMGSVSVLANGKIIMYNMNGTGLTNGGSLMFTYDPSHDPSTTGITFGNIFGVPNTSQYGSWNNMHLYYVNIVNIIPISRNYNLVFFIERGSVWYGNVFFDNATNGTAGMVFSFVVDNDNNYVSGQKGIFDAESIKWLLPTQNQQISNTWYRVNSNLRSGSLWGYNPNYFVNPVTGYLQFTIYNKMFMVKSDDSSQNKYTYHSSQLPEAQNRTGTQQWPFETGIMYSGYYDLLGNFFFNMATFDNGKTNKWIVDPIIYKMTSGIGNNWIITPYTNLNTSTNTDVTTAIDRYRLIPIPGQLGKLMMINLDTGITIAIVQNQNNANVGQVLGTLNGSNPVITGPNFDLRVASRFLMPSQLRGQDFRVSINTILSSISVLNIDDTQGTIEVVGTLSYVPWFEDMNSNNFQIIQSQKTFTGLSKSSESTGVWADRLPINLSRLSPSNVQLSEIAAAEPQQNPFNSLTNIVNKDNRYSIVSSDDDSGKMELGYEIQYRPNLDARGPIQTYRAPNHTYNLLARNDLSGKIGFGLIGGSIVNQDSVINVARVDIGTNPNLIQYKYSNLVASEVAKNSIDIFVDWKTTLGVPLSQLIIKKTPNDSAGELTIEVTIPTKTINDFQLNKSSTTPATQDITIKTTYAGFHIINPSDLSLAKWSNITNGNNNYILNLNQLADAGISKQLSGKLPSQITVSDVISDFMHVQNLNVSQALVIRLLANDLNGTLNVQISKNTNYSRSLSVYNLFSGNSDTQIITLRISGFVSSNIANNLSHAVTAVGESDENLVNLTRHLPSEITKRQVLNLLKMGSELSNIGFTLTEENISLSPNIYSGQLGVLVDLAKSEHNKNLINATSLGINFPLVYSFTFSNFLRSSLNNFLFQSFDNTQLDKSKVDLATLTNLDIFNNQADFINGLEGYELNSASQISVSHDIFNNLVYVKYDFTDSPGNMPAELPTIFGVIYRI